MKFPPLDPVVLTAQEFKPQLQRWMQAYEKLQTDCHIHAAACALPVSGAHEHLLDAALTQALHERVKGKETGFLVALAQAWAAVIATAMQRTTVALAIPHGQHAVPFIHSPDFSQPPADALNEARLAIQTLLSQIAVPPKRLPGDPFPQLRFVTDAAIAWLPLHAAPADFPFLLTGDHEGKTVRLRLRWNNIPFHREAAQHWMDALERVLHHQLMVPQGTAFQWLRPAEIETLRQDLQQMEKEVPQTNLPEVWDRSLARYANRIALLTKDVAHTYASLDARANALASLFRDRWTLSGGEIIAIAMPRCEASLVSQLAIMKCGCTCLHLDLNEPAAQLEQRLQSIPLAAAILLSDSLTQWPALETPLFVFDLEESTTSSPPTQNPESRIPNPNSHVFFTSGSTGQPKAVAITHRAIIRLARQTGALAIADSDVILHHSNPSFDASTFEVWAAWLNGACISLWEGLPDPQEMEKQIRAHGVTCAWFTAGFFHELVQQRPTLFESMRTVIAGGDRLHKPRVLQLRELYPALNLVNGYGPTENTTFTTAFQIEGEWEGDDVPLGLPLAAGRVLVVDANGRILPAGLPGELMAAGAGLASGYLNDAELSAQKFGEWIPVLPGLRLLRTGDLGWRDGEGRLRFLGRNDRQIKVRGYRIEAAAVEAAIAGLSGVKQVFVGALPESDGTFSLCAWIETKATFNLAKSKHELIKILPEYAVPAWWMHVPSLPLTANGKINEKALPDPRALATVGKVYETPTQQRLADLWQELLALSPDGPDSDFFALGGHSLAAIRLLSQAAKEWNAPLSLPDIFYHPRLRDLAALIDERCLAGTTGIPLAAAAQQYPLSHAQQRLWMLSQLPGAAQAYHMPAALRVTGPLNVQAFRTAFARLEERQESLRTVFVQEEGRLWQRILPPGQIELFVNEEAINRTEAEWQTLFHQFSTSPFDLASGPLLRLHLHRVAAEEWRLFLVMHHIISDGWSISVMLREWKALYEASLSGLEAQLPALPVQYKDFAVWSAEQATGEEGEAARNYWEQQFAAHIPACLPPDFPRPAVKSFEGDAVSASFSAESSEALRRYCREEGCSLYVGLTTLVHAWLHRYTGLSHLRTGTVVSGRSQPELEGLIGFFVNSLPVCAEVQAQESFLQALQRNREALMRSFERENYPFDLLVESLGLAGDLSRNPVFDLLITLDEPEFGNALGDTPMGGLKFATLGDDFAMSKFDVQINFRNLPGEPLWVGINYSTDLYTRTKVQRAIAHLLRLAEAWIQHPQTTLAQLPMLSAGEITALQTFEAPFPPGWNQTDSLSSLFTAQVRLHPERVAVKTAAQEWTYEQLNAQAIGAAHALKALGVKSGDRVALWFEPGAEMIAGILACVKLGAAWVPLHSAVPGARLRFMLSDAAPAALFCGSPFPFSSEQPMLHWRDDFAQLQDEFPPVDPQAVAYVIYTSGTTGEPKGVQVTHQNVVSLLFPAFDLFQFSASDCWALMHSYAFDFSVWEMFGPLLRGGKLAIPSADQLRDPAALCEWIATEAVTVLNQTPGAFYLLSAEWMQRRRDAAAMRWVIFGGEALSPQRLKKFHQRFPEVKLVNMYGITETTVHVTFHHLQPADFAQERSIIGKPIPSLRVAVLDANGNRLPAGVPGEMCVSGAGVAAGYLHRPALTAQRFIHTAEGITYFSGDLAQWTEEGDLLYLGRNDAQIKIRGYRIEPAEVAAALRAHPAVLHAHVDARRDAVGENVLCAWVVTQADVTVAALRTALHATLPEFMIPAHLMIIQELPLTVNGKIDSAHLPMPGETAQASGELQPPDNAVQQQLWLIWKRVLQLEQFGIHDSFFELGGHSLSLVTLAAAIRSEMKVEPPLRALFLHHTIAMQAEQLPQWLPATFVIPLVSEQRGPFPLSAAQRRQYVVNCFEGVGTSYNMPGAFLLYGEVQPTLILRALRTLLIRHECLRTSFVLSRDLPQQWIHTLEDDSFFEVATGNFAEFENEVQNWVKPFYLTEAPLFRARLLHSEQEPSLLLFDMHHIASDGASLRLLLQEFFALLDGNELPPIPLRYVDYAAWQTDFFKSGALKAQADFWKEQLAGEIPILNLPYDYARGSMQEFAGDHLQFYFDKELTALLRLRAEENQATLFMTLLSLWAAFLARYCGQQDILIGTPVSGRNHPGLEKVVGMFVNMLAMRVFPDPELSYAELLVQVKQHCLSAYDNSDLPFEDLLDLLDIPRDISRNPLFDCCFLLENDHRLIMEGGGLRAEPFLVGNAVAKFDLTLAAHESAEEVQCTLEFATHLFSRETIAQMAQHFIALSRDLLQQPGKPLHSAEMLTDAERQHLVHTVNAARVEGRIDLTVQERLERLAAEEGDRIALSLGKDQFTYADLNRRANVLGLHLRKKFGAAPEKVIAILTHRSLERMAAIAAVWKSGAAFVPIDPSYPAERVQFLLEDSGALCCLTHHGLEKLLPPDFPFVNLDDSAMWEGLGENLPHLSTVQDLVHIIYTSGSTGRPKGIQLTQFNLLRRIPHNNFIEFRPTDRVLQMVNFTFDVSTHDIYGALMSGSELVLIPEGSLLDIRFVANLIREKQITLLFAATAMMNLLIEADVECLRSIRLLQFGGEAASVSHCVKALKALGPGILCNSYGPAESTVYVTSHVINELDQQASSVPIGKVLANTQVYIVDPYNRIQPVGCAGELCIGGEGLARGYVNQPQLTLASFTENPFMPGSKWYRTGDLARWNHKGELEYLGRLDHQIKVRGFRIEPGEIEYQMLQFPGVQKSLVLPREDAATGRYLTGYYTAAQELEPVLLRQHLTQCLPEYMVPAFLIQVNKFPLTSNGKVDRKALPPPQPQKISMKKSESPVSETEKVIYEWWKELLGTDVGSVHDNFFELGGHSVLVVQLLSRFQEKWPGLLSIHDLFDSATIASQAALVSARLSGREAEAVSDPVESKQIEF